MNGFGPSNVGVFWFNTYWIIGAFFLLIISGVFWARGSVTSIKERMRFKQGKLNKRYLMLVSIVGVVWVVLAVFVYYNTQILNSYKSSDVHLKNWQLTMRKPIRNTKMLHILK